MSRARRVQPIRVADLLRAEPDLDRPDWAAAAEREWGQVGICVGVPDPDAPVVLLAPPLHVPRTEPQGRGPLSPDAAVLMLLRSPVPDPGDAGARLLIQSAAALIARGPDQYAALECRTQRHGNDPGLPAWRLLLDLGFETIVAHPTHPRVRLELRRTVTARQALEEGWQRLSAALRPASPGTASRATTPQESRHT